MGFREMTRRGYEPTLPGAEVRFGKSTSNSSTKMSAGACCMAARNAAEMTRSDSPISELTYEQDRIRADRDWHQRSHLQQQPGSVQRVLRQPRELRHEPAEFYQLQAARGGAHRSVARCKSDAWQPHASEARQQRGQQPIKREVTRVGGPQKEGGCEESTLLAAARPATSEKQTALPMCARVGPPDVPNLARRFRAATVGVDVAPRSQAASDAARSPALSPANASSTPATFCPALV